jgi:hypothetical protein
VLENQDIQRQNQTVFTQNAKHAQASPPQNRSQQLSRSLGWHDSLALGMHRVLLLHAATMSLRVR